MHARVPSENSANSRAASTPARRHLILPGGRNLQVFWAGHRSVGWSSEHGRRAVAAMHGEHEGLSNASGVAMGPPPGPSRAGSSRRRHQTPCPASARSSWRPAKRSWASHRGLCRIGAAESWAVLRCALAGGFTPIPKRSRGRRHVQCREAESPLAMSGCLGCQGWRPPCECPCVGSVFGVSWECLGSVLGVSWEGVGRWRQVGAGGSGLPSEGHIAWRRVIRASTVSPHIQERACQPQTKTG
jgi:hypothetical protein